MGCRANTDCSHELKRWERETATTQKESTRSWFVRAGGSSGACDTMGEEGTRAQQWKEQVVGSWKGSRKGEGCTGKGGGERAG